MNQPHGGALVNRECSASKKAERTQAASKMPRLSVDRNLILEIEKIANGTFSPLTGFMGSKEVESVLKSMRLLNGLPWTIPVVFHANRADIGNTDVGSELAIYNAEDESLSAILSVSELFSVDRESYCDQVFLTHELEHPGVSQVMAWGDTLIAGDIELINVSKSLIPDGYDLSPAMMREEFAKKGWKRIVGFQTRNVGHRAHEYLQKTALEHCDGLLVHPIIGWKKKGDMLPEVVLEGYELLIENYYVKSQVMMAGLTTAMRYAGPREAVFHAIIRKNFGCTHFIVGRDHAGVGGYYEKYAGHKIFDQFGEDLGIEPMRLHGPCYCERCGHIVTEHTCPHEESWQQISGTEVRAMLARGECPPASFMRPEIGKLLVERAAQGRVFF